MQTKCEQRRKAFNHSFLDMDNRLSKLSSTYLSLTVSHTRLPWRLDKRSFIPAITTAEGPPERKLCSE